MWPDENPPVIQPTDLPNNPGGGMNSVVVTNSGKSGNSGKIIAALLGVLLLVGGIGAGLFLVNQQQLVNQKAAVDLQTDNSNCGSIGLVCSAGTACKAGSCVPSSSNTSASAGSKICGQTCNTDSDCKATSGGNYKTICNANKVCANPNCPNNTQAGTICSCTSATQTCGQPCGDQGTAGGGLFPLCGSGSSCGPVGAQCSLTGTYCLPTTPQSGYTLTSCTGSNTQYSYLIDSSGNPATTQTQVQAACTASAATAAPSATTTPTPSPSPTTVAAATTPTPTQKPIPVTGFDAPTIMAVGIGIFLTLGGIILVL